MVTVLAIIPDGAADAPPGTAGTTLARARTPALDRLARTGCLLRARTIPAGLDPGSEVGIPTLLGVRLGAAPGRGFVEAAAAGVDVPAGAAAWRLDLHGDDSPWTAPDPPAVAGALAHALGADVIHLRGHRFLLVGPRRWGDGPAAPHLPGPRRDRRWAGRLRAAAAALPAGVTTAVWGVARRPTLAPPQPRDLTVVAAPSGAAAGTARLLDARLISPPGATGAPGTDLEAKAAAAQAWLDRPGVVAVHVAAPDETAHARDAAAKVAALEELDARLVGPLTEAAADAGAAVLLAPDHATDPVTGRHLACPVPACLCLPGDRDGGDHDRRLGDHDRRVTEAAAADAPLVDGAGIVAALLARRGVAA